jgi:uncharacterized protein (TIGR02285 family)
MKPSRFLFIVLLLALCSGTSKAGDEGKEMEWLASDLSPLAIKDGPQAGRGYFDRIMALLLPAFAGYKHSVTYANSFRRERQMHTGDHICTVSMLYSQEREQYMVFSKPYGTILPNGIILLKAKQTRFKPYLQSSGTIQLSSLIGDTSLKVGLSQGRYYGGPLDRLLHTKDESNPLTNVSVLNGNDSNVELYKLLQRGVIDYVVGYPIEKHYFAQRQSNAAAMVYLPIAEEPALIGRHFACRRTPWGMQRVEEVNRVLESKTLRQQLQESYEDQLDPEDIKLYRSRLEHMQ